MRARMIGYRLGVLDDIAPASFDGLLDREVDGLRRITKSGYIAGRAGMKRAVGSLPSTPVVATVRQSLLDLARGAPSMLPSARTGRQATTNLMRAASSMPAPRGR